MENTVIYVCLILGILQVIAASYLVFHYTEENHTRDKEKAAANKKSAPLPYQIKKILYIFDIAWGFQFFTGSVIYLTIDKAHGLMFITMGSILLISSTVAVYILKKPPTNKES